MNLDESIAEYEDGEVDRVKYKDLYYADGFLYVTAEYSVYDKDSSIGWRDGYRRLRSGGHSRILRRVRAFLPA